MADRTYFYKLAFQAGYLQDVEEAAEDAFGIVTEDLTEAEKEAVDRILRLLTAVVGWATVEEWRDDWMDEAQVYPDHIPRCIRTLAELMGSALVWRRLENYNRILPKEDEILMSDRLMRDTLDLWKSILAAGVIVFDDGTAAIDLTAASGNAGFGASGAGIIFFADYKDESFDGIRPKWSTEGMYKELNG